MEWYEILVIIAAVGFVLANIGVYVYKRIKHLPTGECGCCKNKKSFNNALNDVRKELDEEKCSCGKCNN